MGKIKHLYLLVDMGSLEEIYQGIQIKNVDIAMINNVNTKLALEIGMGIKQQRSMQDIFEDINKTILIMSTLNFITKKNQLFYAVVLVALVLQKN